MIKLDSEQILKEHSLRLTDSRKLVLNVFKENTFAISHSYLEEKLKETHDRVTIYRTLYSFLEKGIIHKVLDEGGSAKYALCAMCEDKHHHHDHVHFKCIQCEETNCLEEIHVPIIKLPKGYNLLETGILMQGVCPKCQKK